MSKKQLTAFITVLSVFGAIASIMTLFFKDRPDLNIQQNAGQNNPSIIAPHGQITIEYKAESNLNSNYGNNDIGPSSITSKYFGTWEPGAVVFEYKDNLIVPHLSEFMMSPSWNCKLLISKDKLTLEDSEKVVFKGYYIIYEDIFISSEQQIINSIKAIKENNDLSEDGLSLLVKNAKFFLIPYKGFLIYGGPSEGGKIYNYTQKNILNITNDNDYKVVDNIVFIKEEYFPDGYYPIAYIFKKRYLIDLADPGIFVKSGS